MPRYFFHTHDGVFQKDEVGTELTDLDRAKTEAVQVLAQSLTHAPHLLWDTGCFSIGVADEAGSTLFSVEVRASSPD
jgi:hypothetical protein